MTIDNDKPTMANPPQELEVIVDPTDLIGYLKDEAQDEWDIAPNQQFLYFNDTLLEESKKGPRFTSKRDDDEENVLSSFWMYFFLVVDGATTSP
eukprot:scaffold8087_cov93-Cylindrotheca_fusiformis.AAC.1